MLLVCAETSRSFTILNNTRDSATLSNIPKESPVAGDLGQAAKTLCEWSWQLLDSNLSGTGRLSLEQSGKS